MSARRTALLAFNLALAAGLWQALAAEPAPITAAAPARAPAGAPLLQAAAVKPPAAGRSYFRIAVVEQTVAAAPPPPAKPRLRLVGVIILEGRKLALVELDGGGTRRLAEGDEIGGWRVACARRRPAPFSGPRRRGSRPDPPGAP